MHLLLCFKSGVKYEIFLTFCQENNLIFQDIMEDEHLCDKRKNSLLENGHEPTMLLQRPSAGISQEVRHILTHIFRDIFTRDALHPETVRNLLVTKDSDDPYHESYVKRLEKVM